MKNVLVAAIFCLAFSGNIFAQQSPDAPASKEEVQKYLQIMNSQQMMRQMAQAMSKPMHEMVHNLYLKDKNRLPSDFEARMNQVTDDMMQNMPWDEMTQAMVPVYQRHFTDADMEALIAFYTSPIGKKVLSELPAVSSEAMTSAMPIIMKYVETVKQNVQDQVAKMLKQSAPRHSSTVIEN